MYTLYLISKSYEFLVLVLFPTGTPLQKLLNCFSTFQYFEAIFWDLKHNENSIHRHFYVKANTVIAISGQIHFSIQVKLPFAENTQNNLSA